MSRLIGVGIEIVPTRGVSEHDAGQSAALRAVRKAIGDESLPCAIGSRADGSPIVSGLPDHWRAHLSITHERDLAVAVAIVEDLR